MALLEKKLYKQESYETENNIAIVHLAVLNANMNDEIRLTYNNGFSSILKIPNNNTLEINSNYISITKVEAVNIQNDYILLQLETNEKTLISQDFTEENYKIQYIKGDRGDRLTWEDLTDLQRQDLSFKIVETYSLEKLKVNITEFLEAEDQIDYIKDAILNILKVNDLDLGFYLFQYENKKKEKISWLYYYSRGEEPIRYVGEFSGPKGEKGLIGNPGNPPKLETETKIMFVPVFKGNNEFVGVIEQTAYEQRDTEGNIIEDTYDRYKITLKIPNYIYFGNPNDKEENDYAFIIDSSDGIISEEPQNNLEYYILSGGTATTLIGGVI